MAKKDEKGRKGIFGRAVDALSNRDEEEKAEKTEEETAAAEHEATLERAKREAAEAKARFTEKKLKDAEDKLKEMENAERKTARMERQRAREQRDLKRHQREQAEEEAKTYVVKSGDSLSKIAKAQLGDASRWPEIFELNKDKIKDPNLIHPGQELDLPS